MTITPHERSRKGLCDTMRTGTQPVDIFGSVVGELFITTQEKAQFLYNINFATYVHTRHVHTILYVSRCARI